MKKNQDQFPDAAEMRRHAEERLSEKQKSQKPADVDQRTANDAERLVHELQIHQIELEMQNEELKQVRAKADALLAQYTDLYDFAPTGYMTLDSEGTILLVNLTGARLLGVKRSGLVKRRFELFVAENDRRAFSDFLEKIFASKAKESCEVTLLRADSRPLYVQIESTLSEDGQNCHAVVLDITARRQAEEQASTAQAETQMLLTLADLSRRALLSAAEDERKAAAELALMSIQTQVLLELHQLAAAPREQLLDFALAGSLRTTQSEISLIGFMDEAETALTVHRWSKETMSQCAMSGQPRVFPVAESGLWGDCVRQRKPVLMNDYSAMHPSKKGIPEGHAPIRRFLGVPVFDGSRIVAVAAVANKAEDYTEADSAALTSLMNKLWDILQRKRANAEILELNRNLEQRVKERTAELLAANQELDAFAYAVSHDLRQPLRAMNGFSQALVDDYGATLPGEACEFLNHIILASRRMGKLIDGLLRLSRSTRGELRRDTVDLSALAARLLGELAAVEPDRQVTWTVAPGLTARGDERMIEVVLANLLGNAWKYTAKTPQPKIEVGALEYHGVIVKGQDSGAASSQHCDVFFVRDNGAGFDMKYAAKLFQPFQRLHREDEFSGIGIGLATVQRIVQRHGGTIRVTATPGQGATFSFSLSSLDGKNKEQS